MSEYDRIEKWIIGGIATLMLLIIWAIGYPIYVMVSKEEEKEWCRDEFGQELSQEKCDES